ncbi:peptidylprolyl isomerase [Thiobacter aerophilum]|uniref:Peptidyl-prolyl cis-trans isomerase n=1 Tax=Thiobacter aerophilum TaxID=3121275 RepID=A0ABV0EBW0_9BURK
MKWILASLALLLACVLPARAANPRVEFMTSHGNIVLELYPDKAPLTVANFLNYVQSGFYEGTIFHRVVNDFIVQGGAFTPDFTAKPTLPPIPSEAKNGLTNEAWTVAMARGRDIDSATSQFFINLDSNKFLNHYKDDPDYYGYCVFGKVVSGFEVVKKIAALPTGAAGPLKEDVPLEPVVIQKVALLPAAPSASPSQPKGKTHGKGQTRHKPRPHLAGT